MAAKFLGAGLAFDVHTENKRLVVAKYEESVEQSIRIILETAKGERVMRPDFGCGIHELVFSVNDASTRGLAEYEVLEDQFDASATDLAEHAFGERPVCEILVATEASGASGEARVLGYALCFPSYSTFKTKACLYLEDLYVTPDSRGEGYGKALFAAAAAIAAARGCPRFDWSVLAWNQSAIGFYESLGAELMRDWRTCRLEGKALERVAKLADRL